MQLQAGYILEGLPKLYSGSQRDNVEALIKNLSYFDFEHKGGEIKRRIEDPFVYVVHNLIARGLPTIAPTFIEEIMAATFLNTKKNVDNRGAFSYDFINDELKDDIYRALHIVDPRLSLEDLKKVYRFEDDTEADLKKKFVFETLPTYIGDYIVQLLGIERSFGSILHHYSLAKYYEAKRRILLDKTVDFVLEVPYAETNQFRGLAIEIEKKLLDDEQIMDLDDRSWYLNQIGWGEIFYLKQSDFYSNTVDYSRLQEFSYNQFFEYIRKNYERPLYSNSYGLDALQLALTPFEVARIQRIIVEYILSGLLDLDAKQWNIAVIERDIPGAFLAIQDLTLRFNHLYQLAGLHKKLPEIKLEVYYTEEFESAALNILYQGDKFLIEEFDQKKNYDLVIDSSVLRYNGLDKEVIKTASKNLAVVRSSRYIDSRRSFLTTDPVNYKPFVIEDTFSKDEIKRVEKIRESFFYFVKNIFRRQSLTDEQTRTLSSALSGKNTLANFPFTGEKTLLYQIVALLQPGLTLVLEPLLVSLFDQIDRLKEYRIDAVSRCCVNSGDVYLLQYNKDLITSGSALFIFATGEDLHTNDLRHVFKVLRKKDLNFTLVVVDQAEFMSPWSPTFNYAYYTVNQNIEKFLPYSEKPIILALSSGMDYDSEVDVLWFLGIDENNVITGAYGMDNLQFEYHFFDKDESFEQENIDKDGIEKQKLGYLSEKELLKENTLVYTHTPWKVYNSLNESSLDLEIGVFDEVPKTEFSSVVPYQSRVSYDNFRRFRNGDLEVLIANRNIAHGLDKPDIRSLVLMSLPVSIEEFVKLLNRVGRDLSEAQVHFLLSEKQVSFEEQKNIVSGHEITEIKQNRQVLYEEYVSYKILKSFKGNLKKDMLLADEILNYLKSTNETLEELLVNRIRQVFGIWVSFDYQPMENPTMIYVYENGDLLGIIDFEENKIDNQASALRRDIADSILSFLDTEIRSFVSKPRDIFLIIKDKVSHSSTSLLNKLVSMSEGESASITIDFSNNLTQDLASVLGKDKFTHLDIERAYYGAEDYNDFREYLSEFVDRRTLKKNDEKIKQLFYRIRAFWDTYRMVYYLIVIGVVDDYLIDFRNQQFVIQLRKLSEDQYINRIYKRISAFVSREKAMEVFQKVPGYRGDSFVHKVLNYWINFEYSYIRARNEATIAELARLMRALFKNKDQQACKFVVSHYFEAKYILDLRERKAIEKENWIKIIDYFIQKVGIFKSNIKHLYKTAEILLKEDRGDYVALMLRGWAGLLLSNDNASISSALDDIAMSLNMWKKQMQVDTEEFITWIDTLLVTLENFNFELKTKVEKLFHLKIFTTWLKDFNNNFIDLT